MELISEWLDDEPEGGIPQGFIDTGMDDLERLLDSHARFQQFVLDQNDDSPEPT